MRDMTPEELDSWYLHHQWPCCGGKEYLEGPRGGLSINLACPDCGMQINVVDPMSHWVEGGVPRFGQVLREPNGQEPHSFVEGQPVKIRNTSGGPMIDATVLLVSPNGVSLMLDFDGVFSLGDGTYAGSMVLLRSSTGEYRDLIQDQPVVIEPRLS